MSLDSTETWYCPLCGILEMKHGTSCKIWPECGNKPHLTGKTYTDKMVRKVETPSLGISKISDE